MAGNSKSFNLIVKENKSFSFIMSYFDYAITFVFNIKPKIVLTYLMSVLSKITQTLTVKKVKILISKMKLISAIIQTINVKKIKIVSSFIQIIKFVINPKINLDLVFVGLLRQKIVSLINMKNLTITSSVILATFYPLSVYDPQTLLTLDSMTLGAIDYTSA
jgi:hypothetical protein